LIAGVVLFEGLTVLGECDTENGHCLADDDFVETLLEWVIDVLDVGRGDLVELMEVGDTSSDDFGDETTDWDGATGRLDDDGVLIVSG